MQLPEYRIIEQTDRTVKLALTIQETMDFFDGHFVNAPIMPAVAQLNLAQHFGEQFFAPTHAFSQLKQVKFKEIIAPQQPMILSLEYHPEKQTISFEYFSDAILKSAGTLLFQSEALLSVEVSNVC